MRNLRDTRGWLPSPSLLLHYVMIGCFLTALSGASVYYFHVEKAMAVVDGTAKQVAGIAARLQGELPNRPEVEAKAVRLQVKADQLQNTAQSVAPTVQAVN